MWKILVLAPVLFLLCNSEVISKRKTYPLSKRTCPCWWDLEGTQIDPNTNEPYKCACCKSGGRQCGYPMHEWCTKDKKSNRRGCIGTANWQYTLSELGHPCHFDKSKTDCAWCTPNGFQCAPPGFDWLPTNKGGITYQNGQYCQRYNLNHKQCGGESLDCMLRPDMCGPNASCKETDKTVATKWKYHQCVCNPGFVGNGITCIDATNLANGTLTSKIIVNIDSTLTKDKVFDPSLEPTIDHGLAEDLFQVIDDIEGDCTVESCDASIMKCGLFQS